MKAFASNSQVCHNILHEQKRMADEALHSHSKNAASLTETPPRLLAQPIKQLQA
jgi:hypothetical protein